VTVKHQDFRNAAVGEAFEAIEGSILPSLTLLIEAAAAAEPGIDAAGRADELRALARQLEALTALIESGPAKDQPVARDPFSTEE
jgi:hypothetical protein